MDELAGLLRDLVSIDSTNPDLVPGAPGEAEIAHYIATWLERAGLAVQVIEAAPGRPNVIGTARGTGGGRTLILNGHMDTVGRGDMDQPHHPHEKYGRLYGRGSYDMKGGLAACMVAAAEAKKLSLRGDVIVEAVADEEYASIGTQAIAGRFKAEGAVVAEFSELRLIAAHKGFVWLEVETLGKAAHGSRPDLGVDAITKMGKVLLELDGLQQRLRARSRHPLLGTGSVHASLIRGGQELSSYPDHCVLSVERRTLPGESPSQAEDELAQIIGKLQHADPNFQATVHRGLDRSPLETPETIPIFRSVRTAAEHVLRRPAQVAGVPFWTDAALLSAAGIPSLLFGPSGSGAHAAEEWVDLASVKSCAQIYLETAVEFCR